MTYQLTNEQQYRQNSFGADDRSDDSAKHFDMRKRKRGEHITSASNGFTESTGLPRTPSGMPLNSFDNQYKDDQWRNDDLDNRRYLKNFTPKHGGNNKRRFDYNEVNNRQRHDHSQQNQRQHVNNDNMNVAQNEFISRGESSMFPNASRQENIGHKDLPNSNTYNQNDVADINFGDRIMGAYHERNEISMQNGGYAGKNRDFLGYKGGKLARRDSHDSVKGYKDRHSNYNDGYNKSSSKLNYKYNHGLPGKGKSLSNKKLVLHSISSKHNKVYI